MELLPEEREEEGLAVDLDDPEEDGVADERLGWLAGCEAGVDREGCDWLGAGRVAGCDCDGAGRVAGCDCCGAGRVSVGRVAGCDCCGAGRVSVGRVAGRVSVGRVVGRSVGLTEGCVEVPGRVVGVVARVSSRCGAGVVLRVGVSRVVGVVGRVVGVLRLGAVSQRERVCAGACRSVFVAGWRVVGVAVRGVLVRVPGAVVVSRVGRVTDVSGAVVRVVARVLVSSSSAAVFRVFTAGRVPPVSPRVLVSTYWRESLARRRASRVPTGASRAKRRGPSVMAARALRRSRSWEEFRAERTAPRGPPDVLRPVPL